MGQGIHKTHYWGWLLLLLGMICVRPVMAQDASQPAPMTTAEIPKRLTLPEARKLAFARNWDLLAAASDVDLATAQRIIAREFPNPTLAFSTEKITVDNHSSATTAGNGLWERNYDTIAAVNQLLEIGGKRSSRRASTAAGFGTPQTPNCWTWKTSLVPARARAADNTRPTPCPP